MLGDHTTLYMYHDESETATFAYDYVLTGVFLAFFC